MLRTLQAPPELGSLREWVIILLLHRLEDIEHARLRSVVQVLVDKESGAEAFEDYMKIAFPYLEGRKRLEKEEAHESLMNWVKSGPMTVTPMQEPKKLKSRLKERVVSRMASIEQKKTHKGTVDAWKHQQGNR